MACRMACEEHENAVVYVVLPKVVSRCIRMFSRSLLEQFHGLCASVSYTYVLPKNSEEIFFVSSLDSRPLCGGQVLCLSLHLSQVLASQRTLYTGGAASRFLVKFHRLPHFDDIDHLLGSSTLHRDLLYPIETSLPYQCGQVQILSFPPPSCFKPKTLTPLLLSLILQTTHPASIRATS